MATKFAAHCTYALIACSAWFFAAGSSTRTAELNVAPNPIQRAPAPTSPTPGAGEQWNIDLRVGFAALYKAKTTFSSIVVGDPKIVNVTLLADHILSLIAKATGATNILFLNETGDQVSALQVSVTDVSPQSSAGL